MKSFPFLFNAFFLALIFVLSRSQPCWESVSLCTSGVEVVPKATVVVGGFLNSMSSFAVTDSVVRFDAYLWFRWPVCQRLDPNSTFSPHATFELVNSASKVDITQKPTFPAPVCDIFPGFAYFELRVEGLFQQSLSFIKFPLDTHDLVIEVEDTIFSSVKLQYQADPTNINGVSAVGKKDSLFLSGWTLGDIISTVSIRSYNTSNFLQAYGSTTYSNYRMGVVITRGATVYFLKVLPPVAITLMISVIVFLLDVEATDPRIATAVGGLMAEIFLQLSFSSFVPSTDYLTLIDWIFNICYLAILLVIIECIVVRKIYYQLLLESEVIQDEIKLDGLRTSSSRNGAATAEFEMEQKDHEDIMRIAQKNREKKEKVKRRIRRAEKILFATMAISCFLAILIATLASRFGNSDTTINLSP